MRYASFALALWLLAAPLAAQQGETAEQRYRRYLADARGHVGRENTERAARSYVQALGCKPDGVEALLGLAAVNRDPARRVLLLQALRLAPQDAAVRRALGRVPRISGRGRAARIEAAYLGYCPRDSGIGRVPSLGLGGTLRRELLVVHGMDAAGDLVPVELELGGTGGLDAGLVARRASARAAITLRDRKSGLTISVPLRLVGPVERVRLLARETRVGPGEMLHLAVGLYDAAGNRIWAPRLKWRALAGQTAHTELLERQQSEVHEDITFEPHRNIVRGPRSGFAGKLAVEVTEPASGKGDRLTIEVVRSAAISRPSLSGLKWAASFEQATARAAKEGRPVLALFYADW